MYLSCLWPRCCVAEKRQTWANLSVLYWHHILMRKVWLIGLNSSKWTDFELKVTTLCFCRIFWWHFLNLLSFCLLCDIRFILCCTSEKRVSQNKWQTYICSVITCLLQRIQNWLLGICQWKLCFVLKMRNDWLGAVLYKMNLSTCIEFRVMKIFLIVNFYYNFR